MLIGGLDNKIEEIKKNINESLQSFTEAELKLKEAEKKTADLDKKINELLNGPKCNRTLFLRILLKKQNNQYFLKRRIH